MIENVMDDLAKMNGGKNMKYELIDELIKDLERLNNDDYYTKEEKIEQFKDRLEEYLEWAEQDTQILKEDKPKIDVDAINDERKIEQYEF